MLKLLRVLTIIISLSSCQPDDKKEPVAVKKAAPSVIAYYSGNSKLADSFAVEKLTHIIFSFCHLRGNQLSVDNANDSATIKKLVALKSRNPHLKVLLSLGGWGGCETCSPVFASEAGRREFSSSTKSLIAYFKADGIDLDWEYPTIEGYPGHAYGPHDKTNFTALIKTLRDTLGTRLEICFAAGGFDAYLYQSVEWEKIMPLLDKINLMSYDLVGGYSKTTGHHTPLYSNGGQKQSTDNAIRLLDSMGVPLSKVIIGAAFYAREWESVAGDNDGLYQAGKFVNFIPYRYFTNTFSESNGYILHRDTVAKAPFAYHPGKKRFATFDDSLSIAAKTRYMLEKGLGGIMFWELSLDKREHGLLDVIHHTIKLE